LFSAGISLLVLVISIYFFRKDLKS